MMGNTYTCDGCEKANLDPREVPKTLHWIQKARTDGNYSANVFLCPECESSFEKDLKIKPEFKAKLDKKKD